MQTDYLWRVSVVEMTIHSVADLLAKGVQRVCLSKNRLAQSPRRKAAFRGFLNHENDFVHGLQAKKRLSDYTEFPRFIIHWQGCFNYQLLTINVLCITDH
jgi:hypothetical protein